MNPEHEAGLPAVFDESAPISLCETLDRVLNKGVVLAGEVLISVADIDLIYLGLQVLLTSVETACVLHRPEARTVALSAEASR